MNISVTIIDYVHSKPASKQFLIIIIASIVTPYFIFKSISFCMLVIIYPETYLYIRHVNIEAALNVDIEKRNYTIQVTTIAEVHTYIFILKF